MHADVAVIGAGAAGMMCAAVAGQRGRRVVLIDHATRIGEKIRISGGGRCNFTNIHSEPANFLSENPAFCRSALARYTPRHFLQMVQRYRIAWHEKHRGQLFCDESAEEIIAMLKHECEAGGVQWRTGTTVAKIERVAGGFELRLDDARVRVDALVIATGGLSIPKIGATDFGHRIARQFEIPVVPSRPALVPLTFAPDVWSPYAELAGLSLEARVRAGKGEFLEDLLFTHRGLSGPAILQISSYWREGGPIAIDLAPACDMSALLLEAKRAKRQAVATVLAEHLPKRLAATLEQRERLPARPLADIADRPLRALGELVNGWRVTPSGTEGYRKAEVTLGGVDTRALSSQTMEARSVPGLHFIGEVVDVTGHLGGHNFQWAWASGHAAGMAV
jgi:predicted Rossmann fold flavoprotein